MTDRRFFLGVVASALWLIASIALLTIKRAELSSMSLNAWGDFFAGCFAPLAFLWLVLGYLQQGEELRLSTEALRLQADELRNSVEQQRQLVEVSRLQVESEREALAAERKARVEEAKPSFVVESEGGAFRGDGNSTYTISLSNVGNTACSVVAELRLQLGKIHRLYKGPAFPRGATHNNNVEVERPTLIEGAIIEINYTDQFGHPYADRYLVTRQTDHPHSSLKLSRVEA